MRNLPKLFLLFLMILLVSVSCEKNDFETKNSDKPNQPIDYDGRQQIVFDYTKSIIQEKSTMGDSTTSVGDTIIRYSNDSLFGQYILIVIYDAIDLTDTFKTDVSKSLTELTVYSGEKNIMVNPVMEYLGHNSDNTNFEGMDSIHIEGINKYCNKNIKYDSVVLANNREIKIGGYYIINTMVDTLLCLREPVAWNTDKIIGFDKSGSFLWSNSSILQSTLYSGDNNSCLGDGELYNMADVGCDMINIVDDDKETAWNSANDNMTAIIVAKLPRQSKIDSVIITYDKKLKQSFDMYVSTSSDGLSVDFGGITNLFDNQLSEMIAGKLTEEPEEEFSTNPMRNFNFAVINNAKWMLIGSDRLNDGIRDDK